MPTFIITNYPHNINTGDQLHLLLLLSLQHGASTAPVTMQKFKKKHIRPAGYCFRGWGGIKLVFLLGLSSGEFPEHVPH